MNPGILLLVTAAVVLLLLLLLRKPFNAYRHARGKRIVTCPETQRPAAVDLDAGLAAATAMGGAEKHQLETCSRWPERHDCGQECLSQIERDPEGCLVRSIVRNWYAGKKCVYCERPFGIVSWVEHRPALTLPGSPPVQWSEFRPEELQEVFSKYQPVCWDCFITESLRMKHPEIVTER